MIDPDKYRISMSGYSIKTGWADDKKIIAVCPYKPGKHTDEQFSEWIDNAQMICDALNSVQEVDGEHKDND